MKTLILNIEDSIFDEIINSLKSYLKKGLQIIDENPTQDDFAEFSEDLRKAFIEIKQIKEGKRQARTWWDAIRNDIRTSRVINHPARSKTPLKRAIQ